MGGGRIWCAARNVIKIVDVADMEVKVRIGHAHESHSVIIIYY